MSKINFNEMMAYEFSALMQNENEMLSTVTVLDCKHCNDPYPMDEFMNKPCRKISLTTQSNRLRKII